MVTAFLVFLFVVILIPSSVLGAYTTLLYLGIRKLPGKIAAALPLLLTVLLPAVFTYLTGDIGNVSPELLPVVGYSLLSLVVTAMAVAPLVPLPLLENTNASEMAVFAASTLSFAFVLLQGFAEVMGAGEPVNTNWTVAALAGIYINCAKMVLVSTIVYAVFAAYSRILESGRTNDGK